MKQNQTTTKKKLDVTNVERLCFMTSAKLYNYQWEE